MLSGWEPDFWCGSSQNLPVSSSYLLQWEAGSFPIQMECVQQETPITSMLLLCLCLLRTPTMAVSTILASEDTIGRLPTLLHMCTEITLPQVCDSANNTLGGVDGGKK